MKQVLSIIFCLCITGAVVSQSISIKDSVVQNGKPFVFTYSGGNPTASDWIGVYPKDTVPDGNPPSCTWQYITTASGTLTFNAPYPNAPKNLPSGKYRAYLFCCDGYKILAGCNLEVTGAIPASLNTPSFYHKDSAITFNYANGTGAATDWIGIYKPGQKPGTDNSLTYLYVTGKSGSLTFKKSDFPTGGLPAGNYVANFFCCDGYEVLASTNFTIFENLKPSLTTDAAGLITGKPIKFKFTGGTGSKSDWVGIYPKDTVPDGNPSSVTYLYVPGINGEVEFDAGILKPGVIYDAHLFCCDDYGILASYKNFSLKVATPSTDLVIKKINVFKVNPNPAIGNVNIQFEKPATGEFTLFTIDGKVLRTQKVNKTDNLKLYNLVPSTYIGRFQNKEGVQSEMIIVQ